jgi:hypothetical protein
MESPDPSRPRFGLSKTWLRIASGVLALVVLWSAAWFYMPPVIAAQAERAASLLLGRQLSVGRVTFNPWTLELTLADLALAGPAAGAPALLEAPRVYADIAWVSLVRLAPVLDRLEIEAPMLRLTRTGDGRYDVDDVLERIAAAPATGPARFAVHNIVLRRGAVDFVDRPLAATHRVRDWELAIPFVSSLPSEREIRVEPHLAFALDGSRFDSAGVATPFAERGAGELRVKLDGFAVAPYLGYLPRGLPAQLRAATLNADVVVAFEQRPQLSLKVAGVIGASGIEVVDAAANDLLKVGNVKVEIDELRPLERLLRLKRIEIDAPHVVAARNAAGRVNLLLTAEATSGTVTPLARVPLPTASSAALRVPLPTASSAALRAASATNGASGAGASVPAPPPWRVSVAALALQAGRLDWTDLTTNPAASLALADFSLNAEKIAWPLPGPVVFRGMGLLGSGAERGKLSFSGQGDTSSATLKLSLAALPLAPLRPYLRSFVVPPLAGELSTELDLDWRAGGDSPQLKIAATRLALARFTLGDAAAPEAMAELLEASDARIDTVARTASIGRLALRAPRLRVERESDPDGVRRWGFERWRAAAAKAIVAAPSRGQSGVTSATSATSPDAGTASPAASAARAQNVARPAIVVASAPRAATTASAAPAAVGDPPWRVAVGDFAIDRGRVAYVDRAAPSAVALEVLDLAVELRAFAVDSTAAAPFHVSARVSVPAGPTGKAVGSGVVGSIDARGELAGFDAGVPPSGRAALLVKDLPLHLLDPYLDDVLDIDVQKAQTSFKGDVRWARAAGGTSFGVRGDATVDDFRATSAATDRAAGPRALAMVREGSGGRQLLNWKSLSLRGIDLAMAPGEATRVAVAETALSDFFARVVLDENGRLNLQDVARAAAPAPPASAASASVSASAPVAVAVARAEAAPAPATPAAVVKMGPIAVVGGRVNYNDRFVKPNYNANLSELSGRLAAFSSEAPAPGQPPQLAELMLRGRVEGTATLEIEGKVNPLATPLALDLHAKVRDLELPPLSPYAIKYSGYGIERGKMSVDLGYVVEPSGKLTASNKIVLNQLAFGEKVEGSTASLPVKLAVALLADRHGVIDLDLPVSGSINDPQFSLGGVIWKAIGNLLAKAVTAPFALLASAVGGGGAELSRVEFAPGVATLDASAREGLDKIATALAERPALTLTVTGESRLDREREAWKKERLAQFVRAEKRRQAIAGGASAQADVTVSESEYPELLKEVYRRADIVKPKNVVGVAKDLPAAEMEALLVASMTVADDAMQQLAVRRGIAVRDYLVARSIPVERLFLGAPKTASDDAAWTPRADLKIAPT